jgi:hypothetical protein
MYALQQKRSVLLHTRAYADRARQDKLHTLLFLVREREPSVSLAGGFPAVIHQKQKVR